MGAASSYTFYQGKDSNGNDIGNFPGTPDQIAEKCNSFPNCRGFNSNGWIKHTISPKDEWVTWTNDPTKGFYVKPNQVILQSKDVSVGSLASQTAAPAPVFEGKFLENPYERTGRPELPGRVDYNQNNLKGSPQPVPLMPILAPIPVPTPISAPVPTPVPVQAPVPTSKQIPEKKSCGQIMKCNRRFLNDSSTQNTVCGRGNKLYTCQDGKWANTNKNCDCKTEKFENLENLGNFELDESKKRLLVLLLLLILVVCIAYYMDLMPKSKKDTVVKSTSNV